MGCNSLPGVGGYQLGLLFLLLAGGPLAFAARVLERRRNDFGSVGVPAGWCQAGFVVQSASLCLGVLIASVVLTNAPLEEFVHWITVIALVDVVVGVRALSAWRRLQAATFAEPRLVLHLSAAG